MERISAQSTSHLREAAQPKSVWNSESAVDLDIDQQKLSDCITCRLLWIVLVIAHHAEEVSGCGRPIEIQFVVKAVAQLYQG